MGVEVDFVDDLGALLAYSSGLTGVGGGARLCLGAGDAHTPSAVAKQKSNEGRVKIQVSFFELT